MTRFWLANPWLAPRQWPLTAQSTQAALDSDMANYAEQHRFEAGMQARGYRLEKQ